MLKDLKELIEIKSVLGKAEEGAPFGAGCRAALDWFLAKAKSYGLTVGQMDGYCGWAEYGEGQHCVAALCHLDVVPAGEGWASDPFCLQQRDGKLYGRGVADDKGAAVMCLHALKNIRESGVKLGRRIRVIVGLNEEHGSACIKHYVANGGEIPQLSFVPDAEFPIINSEKGILHLAITIPLDKFFKDNIAHIHGGDSINVVPDGASVSIFADSPLAQKLREIGGGTVTGDIFARPEIVGSVLAAGNRIADYWIKNEGDVITVGGAGTSGHAMAPHLADNAIWKLFAFLAPLSDDSAVVECMNEYFCTKQSLVRLDINRSDEQSGDNTISMGKIEVDDNSLRFTLDIRLCISSKHEDVKKNILQSLPRGSRLDVLKYSPNLFVDKDSALVKTLLGVYTDLTGSEGYCLRCGGGTYARELPNAVAFGPAFPGVSTNLHKPDECLPVDDFNKAAEIYKETFLRLAK